MGWGSDSSWLPTVATYWLRDGLKTLREQRNEAEKEARDAETDPPLPSMAELRQEDLEVEPQLFLVVRNDDGVVRRVPASREPGLHRVAWDLRWPSAAPTDLTPETDLPPWVQPERGPLAPPGVYSASLESHTAGEWQTLAGPVELSVIPLELNTLQPEDKAAVIAFQGEVRELRRAVLGTAKVAGEIGGRIKHLRQALVDTPAADAALSADLEALQTRLDALLLELQGDRTKAERNVFTPPALVSRVERIASDQWLTTQAPTETHRQAYGWAKEAFAGTRAETVSLESDLAELERRAEAAGAPWTPGRPPAQPGS